MLKSYGCMANKILVTAQRPYSLFPFWGRVCNGLAHPPPSDSFLGAVNCYLRLGKSQRNIR